MNRRFARYLSVSVPAVAAATVLGTGVSFADVGHVAPGPRVVASAPTNGQPAGGTDTSGPGARPHVTHPAAHLTCHENDGDHPGATGGPNPAVKPGTPAAPSARPATSGPGTAPATKPEATSDTDTVTCHWSHVRRHLKAASFELMRSSGGGPGGSGPSGSASSTASPTTLQTSAAKAGSFTDATVAEGQSYKYVLEVTGKDGSLLGTSNTVTVKDDDAGGKVRLNCADHDAPKATGTEQEAVTCHWNRSPSDDFASYRLRRDGSPIFTTTKRGQTHYNDATATEGTTYQYVVDVLDGSGNVIATSNTATVGPDGTAGGPASAHARHNRPGGAGPDGAAPSGTTKPDSPAPAKPADHQMTTHRPASPGTAPAGDHGHGRNGHSGATPGGTGSQPAGTSPAPGDQRRS